MTKKEVVDFIAKHSYHLKKEMRTIDQMIEVAKQEDYDVVKVGADNFIIYEVNAIKDFRKQLIINKDEEGNNLEAYCGVPVAKIAESAWYYGSMFPYRCWCYLANKKSGDYIDFKEMQYIRNDTIENYVYEFDILKGLGYIKETKENIIFYLFPQEGLKTTLKTADPNGLGKRIAPIVY